MPLFLSPAPFVPVAALAFFLFASFSTHAIAERRGEKSPSSARAAAATAAHLRVANQSQGSSGADGVSEFLTGSFKDWGRIYGIDRCDGVRKCLFKAKTTTTHKDPRKIEYQVKIKERDYDYENKVHCKHMTMKKRKVYTWAVATAFALRGPGKRSCSCKKVTMYTYNKDGGLDFISENPPYEDCDPKNFNG
eukprot:TRINITY_DN67764_c0_g1_i1.p1 TRINITY_DN67764_c0_g1~~TRINITY_DN67764_c0_g1_i1.p1  ORF type:complete len:192 (+),score=11.37 TRINITY_DN67764_c0_g1_i1:43-618(+)